MGCSSVVGGVKYESNNGTWWAVGVEDGITDIVIPQYLDGAHLEPVGGVKTFAFWQSKIETAEINAPQIEPYAFMSSHDLKKVTLGSKVKHIQTVAFLDCINLEILNISNGLTDIGEASFASTALNEIFIPQSVTSIGYIAFSDCKNLYSIKVASENIVYDSREDCNAIVETATNTLHTGCNGTVIPNSVTAIGPVAFHMSGIESIYIHDKVTTIGGAAFSSCHELVDVYIGKSIKSIANNAFGGCPCAIFYFNAISCDDFDESETGDYPFGNSDITIGDSVQRIPAFFACGNSNLSKFSIPNSVNTIGKKAFSGCLNLKEVVIGHSATQIQERAFSGCTRLKDVTLGRSVNEIQGWAFEGCRHINATSMNPTPPVCESKEVFPSNVYSSNILYVPKGCYSRYMNDLPVWGSWTIIHEKDFSEFYSDVNSDGEVNIADINTVIDCILKGNQISTSDVNCDGEVNIADINVIIDCILKG